MGILRRGVRVLILDDIAVGKIASDIAGRPVFGYCLCPAVDGTSLKGFKGDIIIEVVVVAQGVEIPASAVYRQVGCPVVFHSRVDDVLAHPPVGNPIGAAGQRRSGERVAELMVTPEGLRHHRQGEQAQHIFLAGLRQRNAHGARRNGLNAGPLVEQAELWHPFGHKFVEGEGDIAGGNRAAIMKAGVRIEGYLHP